MSDKEQENKCSRKKRIKNFSLPRNGRAIFRDETTKLPIIFCRPEISCGVIYSTFWITDRIILAIFLKYCRNVVEMSIFAASE